MAQSPELEETCKSIAKSFFMTDCLPLERAVFPDLKPPGVRETAGPNAEEPNHDKKWQTVQGAD